MKNRTDKLSNNEILDLKKELRASYFTSLTMFLMFMVFLHLMIYIKTEKWTIPDLEILVIIGSVTVFYFATFFFTRELRDEIQDGLKIIEFKTIEEKYDFMDKQDRLSLEFKKFVIIAGGQKYIVTEEQYNQAEVFDYLSLHLTPKKEKTLKIEITR